MCDYGCPEITEEWRDVSDYEGLYQVSNLGRVRSLDRIVGTVRRYPKRGQALKHKWGHPDGYPTVALCGRGRPKSVSVHALVNAAFHGPRPLGPTVFETRHGDGVAAHVCAANLSWATKSVNVQDQVTHGTHRMSSREVCVRGHLLIAPNLMTSPSRTATGRRCCISCHRAHSFVANLRRRGEVDLPDFAELADQYYLRAITESVKTLVFAQHIVRRFLPAALDSEGVAA